MYAAVNAVTPIKVAIKMRPAIAGFTLREIQEVGGACPPRESSVPAKRCPGDRIANSCEAAQLILHASAMTDTLTYGLKILEVAWINILLSGDNAIVIAMACRSLPDNIRQWGIISGSAAAIVLRIIFAFIVTWLMRVPYLQAVGGVLLLWIAVSLASGGDDDGHEVKAHSSLWNAVGTIAVADAAMSLDNVLAIAAIARDDYWLFIFGLILSIPLIVVGATVITKLLSRLPILIWAGAALLGMIAGEMIADDPKVLAFLGLEHSNLLHYGAAAAFAGLVVVVAYILKRREQQPA